ncbi:MAG TPA: RNA polymerase sigma factor [Planctomycetaceae bacterium]|nr:RNA polymerase sigma factor [Planctomycetaceae bacterium]
MWPSDRVERIGVEPLDRLRERFLVRQFQRGNSDAFLALVRRYERRLLFFLRRFERDPERALDVLQEVWLAAWRTRGALRSANAFRAWIYRVAHGKVIEAIRSEMRYRQVEQERQPNEATVATRAGASWETAELVHFALSRISPEHREVLTLRFLEGMSIGEIAEVIDCPEGTVKSRLHYASREILSVIEEQENGGK